jgi:hypothetical protein
LGAVRELPSAAAEPGVDFGLNRPDLFPDRPAQVGSPGVGLVADGFTGTYTTFSTFEYESGKMLR